MDPTHIELHDRIEKRIQALEVRVSVLETRFDPAKALLDRAGVRPTPTHVRNQDQRD